MREGEGVAGVRLTSRHHIARLPGVKRGIGGLVLDAFTARMLSELHGTSHSSMFSSADTWEPFVNSRSLGRMLQDREIDMLRDVAADRPPFFSCRGDRSSGGRCGAGCTSM